MVESSRDDKIACNKYCGEGLSRQLIIDTHKSLLTRGKKNEISIEKLKVYLDILKK